LKKINRRQFLGGTGDHLPKCYEARKAKTAKAIVGRRNDVKPAEQIVSLPSHDVKRPPLRIEK
jgi:hypothetical protein